MSRFNPRQWQFALPLGNKALPERLGASADIEDAPVECWYRWCLPTLSQNGPSCVGQAWANWLELMLRRYCPEEPFKPGQQISGEAIWTRAREMFYSSVFNDGIDFEEGFQAMIDLELIPPDSQLLSVDPDWVSVGYALLSTPIVQGHHVHLGWESPDPASGCIDHRFTPTSADGYHATLRIGRALQQASRFYVSANSWGPSWGWHGLFIMTDREDAEGLMPDGLFTINMPAGWTSWEGWKKGVVSCP